MFRLSLFRRSSWYVNIYLIAYCLLVPPFTVPWKQEKFHELKILSYSDHSKSYLTWILYLNFFTEKKPAKINFFFGIQNKKICQNGLLKIEKSKLDIIKASSDKLFEFEDSIGRIAAEFEFARKREIFLDETSSKNSCKTWMNASFLRTFYVHVLFIFQFIYLLMILREIWYFWH